MTRLRTEGIGGIAGSAAGARRGLYAPMLRNA